LLVRYTDTGARDAPVVILLHGWGADAHSFAGLATSLSGRFRVICLDLPGFGGSQAPPVDWHIHDYAALVAAFVAKLGNPPLAAVIGHSFGGRIAMKALAEGLLAPGRLVLMGSAGVKHSQSARNQAFKVIAKAGKAATSLPGLSRLRSKLRRQLYQSAGSTDYLTAGPLRQVFINTINEDLQSAAAAITAPALLLWGANDADTPPADGRLLASKIHHATFVQIPAAGHFVYLDAPEAVAAHIMKFLP
jgi:pimeloyl-ACP methyl ester carboxylesterase